MQEITRESVPTRGDLNKIYRWCIKNYGRSKINGTYPTLRYRQPDYLVDDNEFGYYDVEENILYVNKKLNKTIIEAIDTLIHEWTHYHQPLKSHLRKARKEGKFDDVLGYNDPMEVEARRVARRDRLKCFKDLFS